VLGRLDWLLTFALAPACARSSATTAPDQPSTAPPETATLGTPIDLPANCRSMPDLRPETTVQAQLDAYNARDIDAFMATFDPAAELFVLGEAEPKAVGRDAVRAIYAELFASSPELHSELVHRSVIGARVIDHERITGRAGSDGVLELAMVYEVGLLGIRRAWAIRP
jgi:hypothetical protein